MIDAPATSGSESSRLADVRQRAAQRVGQQRATLRPLGWAVIAVVAISAAGGQPQPGVHGRSLGVLLALVAFAILLMVIIRDDVAPQGVAREAAIVAAMGGAGVALVALQSQGTTQVAAGVAVWMAAIRLPRLAGAAVGGTVAVALGAATAVSTRSSEAVLATTVLVALLALVGHFMRQARSSQARTEMLLAELEDARDEQARAAAVAERSRIAADLHDVLAHSLSGAAIQLQAARKLAQGDASSQPTRAAIDRAGQLVRDGLASARQAVGALRGQTLPGVADIEALVASFRNDTGDDVTLSVDGAARALPAEASVALYRGTQEALTNIARYAPGARTQVTLRFGAGSATLVVEDVLPASAFPAEGDGLAGVGGGRGLMGMRERVESAGGTMSAGATATGWRVSLKVPG